MRGLMLKIITPNGIFLNKEIEYINAQTTAGDITIYSRHTAIVSTLKIGILKYASESGFEYIHVHRGILKVSNNEVIILSQSLYKVDEKGKKIS